ncbi:MAG: DUF3135 domain-containing protein [Pseudomonadales bacterium]|nr:DUF3135 domain-containing protein [Pseudomonadales bacterium]
MRRKLPAFDVLVDMARNDPDRLETLRQKLTQHVINNAQTDEKKRRLEGLQFQVDMERRRAGSPLAATIRISEMMCHSLADLHKSMVTPLVEESDPANQNRTADVLRFPVFAED